MHVEYIYICNLGSIIINNLKMRNIYFLNSVFLKITFLSQELQMSVSTQNVFTHIVYRYLSETNDYSIFMPF